MFKPRCCDMLVQCCFWGTLLTVLLLVFGLIVFAISQIYETPHYSVTVDSASGLDPAADLGRPTVDPEFNLTLGVASRAFMGAQCLPSGAEVEVWYRGVLLATSGPTRQAMCAAARKAAREPALALGTGVRLPGFVRDSLAADMRRGVQRFDVTMRFGNEDGTPIGIELPLSPGDLRFAQVYRFVGDFFGAAAANVPVEARLWSLQLQGMDPLVVDTILLVLSNLQDNLFA